MSNKVTNVCRFATKCRKFREMQCTMFHPRTHAEEVSAGLTWRDRGPFLAYHSKTTAGVVANCTCNRRRCQLIHEHDIRPDLGRTETMAIEIARLEQERASLLAPLKRELMAQFEAALTECASPDELHDRTRVRVQDCPAYAKLRAIDLQIAAKRRQRTELVCYLALLAAELQAVEPKYLERQRELLEEAKTEAAELVRLAIAAKIEVQAAIEHRRETLLQQAVTPLVYDGTCCVCYEPGQLFGCSETTGACRDCTQAYLADAPVHPLNDSTMPGIRCLLGDKSHQHRFHLHHLGEFLNSAASRGEVEVIVAEKHRQFVRVCVQQQVARERERIMGEMADMSEIDRTVDRISDLITTKCPRCGVAFVLVEGCRAVNCDGCRTVFCHICLEYHASDSYAVHEHVAACIRKHRIGDGHDYYASDRGVRRFHIDRFSEQIKAWVDGMAAHKRDEVLERVAAANSDYRHLSGGTWVPP